MSKPIIDDIVAQMRAERGRRRLTLSDVAQFVGLPGLVIGAYERGDRQPPLPKLRVWVEGMAHQLVALPTLAEQSGATRVEHAVAYGHDDSGLIECDSREEAAQIAARMPGAKVVSRRVLVGMWEPGNG
jgi:transcriptional regulator with XRE-family HTH domain